MAERKAPEIRDAPGRPWVIVAPERRRRAAAFAGSPAITAATCPFCPEHEDETPPEILRVARDGDWIARVVPNKYPASPAHEVIIETREHSVAFDELPLEHAAALVELYAARFEANRSWAEVVVFKNEGRIAGASMPHPHSQVIGLERVSPRREAELSVARCERCQPAASSGTPIARTTSFSVIAPFASAYPCELAIVPHDHEPAITESATKARELARLMQQAVRGIRIAAGAAGYNWVFHNASSPPFHWYLEMTPRLAIPGGFEIATRSAINVVTPEAAAGELRSFFEE